MGTSSLRKHARHVRAPASLALLRRVEDTLVHRTLSRHLETFLERAQERSGVPRFVEREMRRYLACGIAAHGFVRVHCGGCGLDRLVPFSCKGRGFCPSCGGRRMAEASAHLVDRVMPEVPVRQWVLSLPFALRFAVARDHALLTSVTGVVMRAILGFQRRQARRILGVGGRCGAVTAIQRFGSALNLNVHFHAIVLDGVHAKGPDGALTFHVLPGPTAFEIEALTDVIARRVGRLLLREGRSAEGASEESGSEEASALEAFQAASVQQVAAFGRRAGRPLRRLVLPAVGSSRDHEGRGVGGFDLDVGPAIGARDRARLERLCRYALRPPLATERLQELDDGRLKYVLRHPWRDGTSAVILEPMDLLARLAALVPPPRRHSLRYHGTLAPAAKWRRLIVPVAPGSREGADCAGLRGGEAPSPAPRRPPAGTHLSWAELLHRVFAKDALECPRCKGRMTIVAIVTEPKAIAAILECLGLPARPPPLAPPREREQRELELDA